MGDYAPATIVDSDAAETVERLKREVDGDLILRGSLALTHSLLGAGAVDGVRLVVLPVAIGSGRGVFPAGGPPLALRLLGSQTFDSLVAVDYAVGDGTQPSRG